MATYQQCVRCVMDTSDPDISFDEQGFCNHCNSYRELKSTYPENVSAFYKATIDRIKKRGRKYSYDCLLGVSGGTDSSYLLHQLKNSGLRILAVHYDSGWNTPEAVHNVKVLTEKMNIDLYTCSVDWEEFKALQLAYFKAGVVDLEVPTDHALVGWLYKIAIEKKIPFILTGTNLQTESITPKSWVFNKLDSRNILDIYRKFGAGTPLKTFPILSPFKKFQIYNIHRIERVFILNYVSYNKEKASEVLKETYAWEPVRVKHGESIWTRFYQCYILPVRYGVDKRKAHYSNLIMSGVLDRKEAVRLLEKPIYHDNFEEDRATVVKRFGVGNDEFDSYFKGEIRSHDRFKSEEHWKSLYYIFRKTLSLKQLLRISTRH